MCCTKIFLIFLTILSSGLSKAQSSTKSGTFDLNDTVVATGQYYRLFDLNFSGKDSLTKVNADKRLDSLIIFFNKLKVKNVMVMYSHYSAKGDFDNECIKLGWGKAAAIKKYLKENGLGKTNVVQKTKCYRPEDKKKMKHRAGTKNTTEFASIFILSV